MSDPLTLSAFCASGAPGLEPLIQCSGRLLCEAAPSSPKAEAITGFIQRRFLQAYGALPELRIPRLLALTATHGALLAAVGVRNAGQERLFLEDYLDAPVETLIASDVPVQRNELAEIAHLAGVGAGVSRFLFAALTLWLRDSGYRWIAFTGTEQLRNSFRRLGVATRVIAMADPSKLPNSGAGWGQYYQHKPVVMVANVQEGYLALRNAGLLGRTAWLNQNIQQEERYGHAG